MALATGTRLGVYEIAAPIGAGGMGEVYRARDTNLDRDVAIKILPDPFAHDAERLARFEREARTLASLNHPNIAIIHGLEKADGIRALVMELVEGPTLADRIAQGAIPIDEALPIARQITEALEAAHEQGIVHRDLKPANIKVRPDGTVKVLDFGLAKAFDSSRALDVSQSPTITSPAMMTGVGILLGTVAYMAPEQARGRPVDRRADIWAFGCVLYEMLAGRRAFAGDDVSDVLASVLAREPDWTLLPRAVSPVLAICITRCLQKDRKQRIGDAQTMRLALEGAFETAPAASPSTVTRRWRERLAWGAVAVLVVIALTLAFLVTRRTAPAAPEMRVEITTPATSSPLHFALSPDGTRLAFVASGNGQPRLWLRALEAVTAQPLPGTENAEYPFWSPDSRSIGFFAGGKLKRIDITGGPPQEVTDAPTGRGGAWNADGSILFAAANAGPLWRVAASGGEATAVTRIEPGHISHRFPWFFPDGRHFLFFVQGATQGIYFGSLDRQESRRLVTNDTAGAWAPPNRLLFIRQGTLVATPFDVETGEITGTPTTVANSVSFDILFNLGGFSVSSEGRVAYRIGGAERNQLTWFERDGKPVGTVGGLDGRNVQDPELSSDGRRVAVTSVMPDNQDVWLIDLVRGARTRFTFDAGFDGAPLWSPDGTRIAFRSNRKGAYDLYLKPSSGAGGEELLRESAGNKTPLSWSSNGGFLLFYQVDPKTSFDLWIQPLTGDGTPSPWLSTPFTEAGAQFSPDGRWVAYQSNESGQFEIYVQPFPAASAKWQISTQGGTMPRWRADGRELFFIATDAKLMAAAVTASGTTFETAPPVALFQTRITGGSQIVKHQYAVAGDRFLINEPAETSTTAPITLILNWEPRS
jgi:eukaryotic-like serine/threonine-protein kinase